ncbi:winged helix-turn-helix domain-containing protein [Microbacterium oleivorans]|uniref:DNA glycosylase AlkZ-like family protein n=1 Tax=Microbacterium oleivorans TaxID=273677 RepID=UPI0010A4F843|nr:crosslink repair DNA glycosylase YcaQ family protein [Microbacterium oleivorans]THE06936.1 winged helix-turn-helix domain-containing protein [Microbacterium oleivorans]
MQRLTRDEARRIAVRAQLLDADRPGDVVEVAEQIGAIKIDPTAVIAPSEQSVCWTRIGWAYEPGQLSKAVEVDRLLFEYDGHFRPASLLPALRAIMPSRRLGGATRQYLDANAAFRTEILKRLDRDGPLQASEIPDTSAVQAKNESGWYGANQVPRMLELMSYLGDVAISGRVGRQRVWDLPERVYAGTDAAMNPADAEEVLAGRRLQALGIARQKSPWSGVGTAGEEAEVEGSSWRWRVDPEAIAALDDDPGGRAAILNPYDRMLFDRPRLTELFGFTFVLEQFKPKHQRVYGYFAHPILVGDRFVALLDAALDKKKENLVVAAVHELAQIDDDEREMIHAEIRDLGEWLGVPVRGLE